MIPKRAAYMFDELDDDGFARLCNVLVPLAHGHEGFSPSPLEGIDGGDDSKSITGDAHELVDQYKFHNISGWAGELSGLRSKVLAEFSGFLQDQFHGAPGPYIFITNVKRTKADTDKTTEIIREYQSKGAKVEYWDSVKILSLMDANSHLYGDFLPHYLGHSTGKTLKKIEASREALQAAREKAARQAKIDYRKTDEFVNVSRKFKTQFIDWDRLAKSYHAFVYLVEPVYIDDKDGVRAIMRDLFHINEETEAKVLDGLKADGRLDVTGNIMTVNRPDDAAAAAAEMLNTMGADLEKIITLIQGA
jgi:hypothetical protein